MLSTTVSKRLDALGTISKQGKQINGLFRLLENHLLWYEAYANIYANIGAITPGVDGTTLDGFSGARVTSIITNLKNGTYRFQPVRRAYVPKKNGKKRPLGISSGDDKLVQEVVRIILERIYEPLFDEHSHGFRPRRSPHTALEQIDQQWQAVKWMVDLDIRDYFNTINHAVLMDLRRQENCGRPLSPPHPSHAGRWLSGGLVVSCDLQRGSTRLNCLPRPGECVLARTGWFHEDDEKSVRYRQEAEDADTVCTLLRTH